MTWHDSLPWQAVRRFYRFLRRSFFTRPRPKGPYVRVPPTDDMAVQAQRLRRKRNAKRIRKVLGVRSYSPNWEFSYNKRGEDLNLARVVYEEDPDSEVRWWQIHVRGWIQFDGSIELTAHWEPEPTEHADEHLNGVGFDRERGMKHLKQALRESGIDFEEFTHD